MSDHKGETSPTKPCRQTTAATCVLGATAEGSRHLLKKSQTILRQEHLLERGVYQNTQILDMSGQLEV